MSAYNKIADVLRGCSTHETLLLAWTEQQPNIRELPAYARSWMTALKDQRKRMIDQGAIEDYDESRRLCDLVDWCDHETRERVRLAAVSDRARVALAAGRR